MGWAAYSPRFVGRADCCTITSRRPGSAHQDGRNATLDDHGANTTVPPDRSDILSGAPEAATVPNPLIPAAPNPDPSQPSSTTLRLIPGTP